MASTSKGWRSVATSFETMGSPVGPISIAASPKGICLVSTHEGSEFCNLAPSALTHTAAREIEEYFEGTRTSFDVPLDLRGTEFQESVWKSIEKIPYGELQSYGGIAAMAGKPRANQATGGATGSNPVMIIIPCHRVVASGNKIGGYGGGLDMKKYLLDLEGSMGDIKQ